MFSQWLLGEKTRVTGSGRMFTLPGVSGFTVTHPFLQRTPLHS